MDGTLVLIVVALVVVALLAASSRVLDRMPQARLPVVLLPVATGVVIGIHTLRLPWGLAGYGFATAFGVAAILLLTSLVLLPLARLRATGIRGLVGVALLMAAFYATWWIGDATGSRAERREASRQTVTTAPR